MRKYNFCAPLVVLLLFMALCACKKNSKGTPAVDVYIAGEYLLPDGITQSVCYWKNGILIHLKDESKISHSTDLQVINGSVYISGFFDDIPCYWKDGVRTDMLLTPGKNWNGAFGNFNSEAMGLGLFGGHLTVVGNGVYTSSPNTIISTIWQPGPEPNTEPIKPIDPSASRVYGTTFANDKMYIATSHSSGVAGYWLAAYNVGTLSYTAAWHPFGNTLGEVNQIVVDQNDVYAFGSTLNNGVSTPVYWKNDQVNALGFVTPSLSLNRLLVQNGNVLFVGDDNGNAVEVINGQKTILSSDPSTATNGAFNGADTYITGTNKDIACYWKNGTLVSLTQPKSFAKLIKLVPAPQ